MTTPEDAGPSVEEIIGTTIHTDCSQKQLDELAVYISENPNGVRETARKVAAEEAAGKIDASVPILLARLRNGQHRKREKQQTRSDLDVVQFAERRYHAKMNSFAKHGTNPDEWGEPEALEYAVDWTIIDRKDCAMTADELMTALCQRLGVRYRKREHQEPAYTEAQVALAATGLVEFVTSNVGPPAPDPLDDEDDDIPGYEDPT